MKEYLRYILYGMVYIVLCFIAVCFLQWFTKPVVEEGFAESAQNLVFAGIGGSTVYFADVDVPINPRWIQGGGGVTFLAGSYGNLYITTSASSPLKKGAYNSTTWASTGGSISMTQMSIDDSNGAISAVGSDGSYYYAASDQDALVKPPGASVAGGLKWVSATSRRALGIGKTDGKIYFTANAATGVWTASTTSGGWKLVVFDGHIACALKTDGSLYSVDQVNTVAPTDAAWQLQGTMKFNHISLKAGRLVGIATDGKAYYSNTYRNPSWTALPMKQYNSTGATVGTSDITLTQIEIFDAPPNFRRKRFVTNNICNPGEEKIGSYCYQACPSGEKGVGDKCSYMRRETLANVVCTELPGGIPTEYKNGRCIAVDCRQNNGTPSPTDPNTCMGKAPVNKTTKPAKPVIPASYACPPSGSVPGRYIRIRASNVIKDNNLCISSVIVKDSDGNVLSNDISSQLSDGSTTTGNSWGVANATDGICKDGPIGGISCQGRSDKSYYSSGKYNTDSDAGFKRRSLQTYWEVDLQAMKNIKTVDVTCCNTSILGMRIEILNENDPLSKPVVSRTFGKDTSHTFTFNFTALEGDSCYDPAGCPNFNGEQSTLMADGTCAVNLYDVIPRSIVKPIILDDCYNQDGTMNTEGIPYSMYVDAIGAPRKNTCVKCPSKNYTFYAKGCAGTTANPCKQCTSSDCTKAGDGMPLSAVDIPTAFADDYYNAKLPFSNPTYINSAQGSAQGSISSIASKMLSSLSRYILSEKLPSKQYYVSVGFERKFTVPQNMMYSLDNGICVESCPAAYPNYDDIKMVLSTVSSTNTYTLYGATCSSNTNMIFDRPYINAIYIPQSGDPCKFDNDNTVYVFTESSGTGTCTSVCAEDQIDSGDKCSEHNEPRKSMNVQYSCATGLELSGYKCLSPCDAGTVAEENYCVPLLEMINPNADIKCLKTTYAYARESASGSSKTVNKWLCESQGDIDALIKGPTDVSTSKKTYVRDDDIVCLSAGDSSVNMYTCRKVVEPVMTSIMNSLGLASIFKTDYSYVCDNLTKAYADLKNNIDIMQSTSNAYSNVDTKVRNILTTLREIQTSLCTEENGSSTYCTAIQTDINALETNAMLTYSDGTSNSGSQTPIQLALTSRDALLAQISKFQCKL
ncbi:hypothetical protein EBV26_15135 [bacterium]|nr:hypothetical protein [bacterium]